jgi:thymidylate synthase
MKIYKTPSEAYLGTLKDILENPEYISSPRGQRCYEKMDYTFKILNPSTEPIKTLDLERNKVIESYTAKEVELYNSCTNLAEDFGKASKFWLNLANPDGTVNSAYGHLIWAKRSHGSHFELSGTSEGPTVRTPWEWAKGSLIRDKDTRQAVLRFSLPEHFWIGNKDFVCTLHGLFSIREDRLNLTITIRSQDMVFGSTYDWPWFCSLINRMVEELKPSYPNLVPGTYTHIAHNIHIYERDLEKVKKMLGM